MMIDDDDCTMYVRRRNNRILLLIIIVITTLANYRQLIYYINVQQYQNIAHITISSSPNEVFTYLAVDVPLY